MNDQKMLLAIVTDLSGRSQQASFMGIPDIFSPREEKEYDEIVYIILDLAEDAVGIKKKYEAKGWQVVEREIFA